MDYRTSVDGQVTGESGTFILLGEAVLYADSSFGVDGGTQHFFQNSILDATVVKGVTEGAQHFYGGSQLLTRVTGAVSGGVQNFHETVTFTATVSQGLGEGSTQNFWEGSSLVAAVANSVGGTQNFFGTLPHANVDANVTGAISAGIQHFYERSNLEANAADAVNGGTQTFHALSTFNANVADALHSAHTLTFDDDARLYANTSHAISGGTQEFIGSFSDHHSELHAEASDAVSGGTQNFTGVASNLVAAAARSVSGGEQTFQNLSSLIISAANGVVGGTQVFQNDSTLVVNETGGLSGGVQTFADSARLILNARQAVGGGTQTFSGSASIKAQVASALTTGSVLEFTANTHLDALAARSVNTGTQNFHDSSILNSLTTEGVTGGTQVFRDAASLKAWAFHSVHGANVTLKDESSIFAFAEDSLGSRTKITFDATAGGTGGILYTNGFNTTVGEIRSLNNGGKITNQGGAAAATFTVAMDTVSRTFGGMIENGVESPALSFEKKGTGVLTLTGTNAYTGATAVNAGTLRLDFSDANAPASNIVSSASQLSLGGGKFEVVGKNAVATSQTFSSMAVAAGGSRIVLTGNGATSVSLDLGDYANITRATGGTVDFTTAAGTAIALANTPSTGTPNGWATYNNGSAWAVFTGGTVSGFSSYDSEWGAGKNTDVSSALTATLNPVADSTTATLRFNEAAANTVVLQGANTISEGGILVTGSVGNNRSTISGGTITGKAGADLIVQQFNTANALEISSGIADNGGATGLTKSGAGTLILSGNNTYTGPTTINEGKLVQNSTITGNVIVNSGGIFGGSGHINGTLTIQSGGTISPGNSPGTATAASSFWVGGGTYLWELNSATGTKGADPGWDLLDITGALDISSTLLNPFIIDINSLTQTNLAGVVYDFDQAANYSWTIASAAGGITGFNSSAFMLDTTHFSNIHSGDFSIAQAGNDIVLSYTAEIVAAPEPGRLLLLVLGVASAFLRRRR